MREIKFRSWDKSVKKMSNPYNIQRQPTFNTEYKGEFCISTIKPSDWLGFNSLSENERQIAMQYTGLSDKNCIDIYEGDIVNSTLFGVCEVVYFKNAFITQSNDSSYTRSSKYLHGDNCEVLGNIYENPELLDSNS